MTAARYEIMLDCLGSQSHLLPPAAKVAGYLTGAGIAWTAQEAARFKRGVVPIDQAPGVPSLWLDHKLLVLDVESGAKNISDAVVQARGRADHGLHTVVYIQASRLSACRASMTASGLAQWVTYLVANWNLSEREAAAALHGDVVAIQFASPTSNPHTLVPGLNFTLQQANVDLSVTITGWGEKPAVVPAPRRRAKPPAKPHRKVTAAGAAGSLGVILAAVLQAAGVHLTPAEASALATVAATVAGYLTPAKGA